MHIKPKKVKFKLAAVWRRGRPWADLLRSYGVDAYFLVGNEAPLLDREFNKRMMELNAHAPQESA